MNDLTPSECRALWLAKINIHLMDLSMGGIIRKSGRISKKLCLSYRLEKDPHAKPWKPYGERLHQMRQAYQFFIESEEYEDTCEAAGVDPDIMFEEARKWINRVQMDIGSTYQEMLRGMSGVVGDPAKAGGYLVPPEGKRVTEADMEEARLRLSLHRAKKNPSGEGLVIG